MALIIIKKSGGVLCCIRRIINTVYRYPNVNTLFACGDRKAIQKRLMQNLILIFRD
jgi:hypothetical protein